MSHYENPFIITSPSPSAGGFKPGQGWGKLRWSPGTRVAAREPTVNLRLSRGLPLGIGTFLGPSLILTPPVVARLLMLARCLRGTSVRSAGSAFAPFRPHVGRRTLISPVLLIHRSDSIKRLRQYDHSAPSMLDAARMRKPPTTLVQLESFRSSLISSRPHPAQKPFFRRQRNFLERPGATAIAQNVENARTGAG